MQEESTLQECNNHEKDIILQRQKNIILKNQDGQILNIFQ